MNLLITGATGFIGSHLVAALLADGRAVTALVRPPATATAEGLRRFQNLERLAQKNPGQLRVVIEPIDGALATALAPLRPEVCVHLAGRSSVRESIQNPRLYHDANCAATVDLLQALQHVGCRRVIHASTVMVYGKDAPLPYREDALGTAPGSPYGASKLAAEAMVNTFRALHGMETLNLRFFSVYGVDIRRDAVPFLIADAILKGRTFNVFGDGGSQRDYVAVADVVSAVRSAIDARQLGPLALNVGSGRATRLIDLIRMIEAGLGRSAVVAHQPAVAGELASIVADVSVARGALNWSPSVSIEEGIAGFCEWMRRVDGAN